MPVRPTFLAAAAAACLGLALSAPAQAEPTPLFVPYAGSGNLVLFDPASGSGGWVGSLVQVPDPAVAMPLSLVSVVLFDFDALSGTLTGSFEFTDAVDLGASLFGTVVGSTLAPDVFGSGGQFSIDYTISGGTGAYAGASGFGLAFLNYSPDGGFDNYSEDGLLVFNAVPEPGSLALVLAGGLSLLLVQRLARRTDRRTPAHA
jgi:uncharacterized membrane protein AbrB (regulator of aidB expression)